MPRWSRIRVTPGAARRLTVAIAGVTLSVSVSAPPNLLVATRAPSVIIAAGTAARPIGPAIARSSPIATVGAGPATAPAVPATSAAVAPGSAATAGTGPEAPWRAAIGPHPVSTGAPAPHPANAPTSRAIAGLFEDLEYLTGQALNARLDQYAQLGVRIARFQLIWANVQSAGPDSYDWQYVDAVISGLRARGIAALPVIDTTPAWARLGSCSGRQVCAPADPNTYAAFAAVAAARYAPQGVHSWEIWNEPNNPLFWQPAPSAAAYTALLRAADVAIHNADPTATVVTGGLAPATTGNGWVAPLEFLDAIYANGGQGSFDAVGWHPYDFPAMPGSTSNNAWNQMSGTTPSARSLMAAHGDAGKQIWATEFGAPTCTGDPTCVSEAAQALAITAAFALWRSASWAGPLVAYTYSDTGQDQGNREDYFGLVRWDGSQKPGYAAFHVAALATG